MAIAWVGFLHRSWNTVHTKDRYPLPGICSSHGLVGSLEFGWRVQKLAEDNPQPRVQISAVPLWISQTFLVWTPPQTEIKHTNRHYPQ